MAMSHEEHRFNLISKSLRRRFRLQQPGYKMTDASVRAEWRKFLLDVINNGRNDDEFVVVAKELLSQLNDVERRHLTFASTFPKVSNRQRARNKRRNKNKSGHVKRKFKEVREYDKLCRYCLERPATTVDHIIPRSRGGSNYFLNIVGCCLDCNHKKADLTPKEAGMLLHLPLRFFNKGATIK